MSLSTPPKNRSPIIPVLTSCVYLLVLFLGIISYMYGSLYRSGDRVHNLNVLVIDYDNNIIGQSLRTAYERLRGPDFPSLQYRSASEFPYFIGVDNAICSQDYWGVIYTHPGASERLLGAVSGNDTKPYYPNNTISIIYSGAHYPVIGEAYIVASLQELAVATSQAFFNRFGGELLSNADVDNPIASSALFQPIRPAVFAISPINAGNRVLLNTITMVVPPLMQFFFIMALDHISAAMHVYTAPRKRRIYLERLAGSKAFSFAGALAITALVYAFREEWELSAVQYVEMWLCFWLYMDVSYLVMDSFIGTIVVMRFAPFFIFTWVILNVTSTLFPFELNPGFYKMGYALPAHNIWLLLMSIWSQGCISNLPVALPIILSWWLVGHVTSAIAVWRKCTAAAKQWTQSQHKLNSANKTTAIVTPTVEIASSIEEGGESSVHDTDPKDE